MSDPGPSQVLLLNLGQTRALALCVDMMIKLDAGVLLNEDVQKLAEEAILAREGVSGVARADRLLAAARERLPVLRDLRDRLGALGETLETMWGAET